jgi:capsular polysaccharide transport system ATP-binding protein
VARHTGRENCRHIAGLYGLDPDYVEAFCRWLAGIAEYFDMAVGTYSAGVRARFTFSLMLALDFDIYLIHEGMPQTTPSSTARPARCCASGWRRPPSSSSRTSPRRSSAFAHQAAVLRDGPFHLFDSLEEARELYDYQA